MSCVPHSHRNQANQTALRKGRLNASVERITCLEHPKVGAGEGVEKELMFIESRQSSEVEECGSKEIGNEVQRQSSKF